MLRFFMKLYKVLLLLGILNFTNVCVPDFLDLKKSKDDNNLLLLALALSQGSGWVWNLPPGFPIPTVPSENPMSQAKVDLGKFLFYDSKLSANESMACSSCHFQNLAFSDGKTTPSGITSEAHPRNAQQLSNAAYHPRLTWSNPLLKTLEQQARVPMFSLAPPELGLANEDYLGKLKSDSNYQKLFSAAFGNGDSAVTEQNVRFSLASFQRTMISGYSPYDKATNGNRSAMSASATRGASIFNGEVAECFHCHGGFNFTDTTLHTKQTSEEFAYHNNGTHTQAEYLALPINKRGLEEITLLASDQGKFRAPSLRNVGVTFPYMHDGSIMCDDSANPGHPTGVASGATLETCARNALGKVIDQYVAGGKGHPNVDTTLIRPFSLQPSEKTDLINFLLALTDSEFLTDSKFSNPFQ